MTTRSTDNESVAFQRFVVSALKHRKRRRRQPMVYATKEHVEAIVQGVIYTERRTVSQHLCVEHADYAQEQHNATKSEYKQTALYT